ncbi:MAG: hypothetical protein CBB71_21350 [Rhodopirellula sp. TMED11]|nr:MAG: hypothetical protein CBB71_21350 [Rhodopirellula sp. TMED11]
MNAKHSPVAARPSQGFVPRTPWWQWLLGVLAAICSAVVMGICLAFNGLLTARLVAVYLASGEDVLPKEVIQLSLFTFPVLMLIVQWVILDWLRGLFFSRQG